MEVREGNFEISDLFNDQDRKQIIFYKQLLLGASLFLAVFGLMMITISDSLLVQALIILVIIALMGFSLYFAYQFHTQLTEVIMDLLLFLMITSVFALFE
ncbi:MAG: hypothetical protein ACC656_11915 [Candidatus Heimdallarchaeota archaeon]